MGEEVTRGQSGQANADSSRQASAPSGWVTTKQAARSLGISPRTVRWHIEHGNIVAEPQGEGVQCTWLVSIDSLQTFRNARQAATKLPSSIRAGAEDAAIAADVTGNPIRALADRLAEEAAWAAEYRVRLELTEQAQSTLEAELAAERQLREVAERERDELRLRLERSLETRDVTDTASEGETGTETPANDTGEPRRSSWWRRFFGFDARGPG